ncbi:MAG: alpha/beta hydrolase [Nevskiales bacterium]|nr:alpha/beta hydrolase [Nevskiales bacterium]
MKVNHKQLRIGLRTRIWIVVMRLFIKPMLRSLGVSGVRRVVREQIRMASHLPRHLYGLPTEYRIVHRVPGPSVGDWSRTDRTVILYLHGGAFLMPAVPRVHLPFLASLCRDLDAVGFMPDYRLAPFHKYPASLDDCERAYRGLLEAGFAGERIVIVGESAGGNLTLGLLQRIRRAGLPRPACAVPISAVTEMARVHAPPSRVANFKRDPIIPLHTMGGMLQMYAADLDGSDPELSPLYADFNGFPPLYFLVGESEVLLDDTLLAAQCADAAGVDVRVDVWPVMPHAFPLFQSLLPETRLARQDIGEFIRRHTPQQVAPDAAPPLRAVRHEALGPMPAQ